MRGRRRGVLGQWRVVGGIVSIPFAVGIILWLLVADKNIDVLNPVGVVGAQEKDLIMFTLLLSAIVVIPVFIMLSVFAWKYHEDNHKSVYTPDNDSNRWIEALWWGIPIIIIGILCVVTWVTSHQLDPSKPLTSNVKPLKVQVVALQWRWLFIYPEQRIATINELVIPAGTPINFEITADAPMSAFWIPSLGTQVYAMTGMSAKLSLMADRPGQYRGTNSNINGKGYADMNFEVSAMPTRRNFDLWVEAFNNLPHHDHIDFTSYKVLSKPSTDNYVAYYHLHDLALYTDVIRQYTHGGHDAQATDEHSQEHKEGQGN
jgi:cytochrome o ubiquinol oxidase subunit II